MRFPEDVFTASDRRLLISSLLNTGSSKSMAESQYALTNSMLFSSLERTLHSLRKGIRDLYAGETGVALELSHSLRTLVCESKGNGLLWRVMEIVSFDDRIDVPDMQKALAEQPDDAASMVFVPIMSFDAWKENGVPLQLASLKEYIKNGEAIRFVSKDAKVNTIAPGVFIRTVANKMGSHTDDAVPEMLATLASLKIGETSSLVRLIASYSRLVAEVGERALVEVELQGYERKHEVIELPKGSLTHATLGFDLDVPEIEMPDIRHMNMRLRMRSAQAAYFSNPPFRIGGGGIAGMTAEAWVGHSLGIEVFVYFAHQGQCRFIFKYPKANENRSFVDIRWNDSRVRVEFDGEGKEMARR